MQNPIDFGVVGLGVIGELRAESVHRNPATNLAAIADAEPGRMVGVAKRTGAEACEDYHALLARENIAAVIISTPVHTHAEMALAAFRAGKHVLCEKPLTNNLESARQVFQAAQKAGRTLAVGFNHRYYPAVKFLKRAVDKGLIGDLDHLRVFGGHDGLANFRADWMFQAELSGGGAMMDVGLHMSDLARHVLGEVCEVYGVTGNSIWEVPGSEDRAFAILKGKNGIPAIFEATWNEWKGYQIHLEAYGRKGMVRAAYAPMFNMIVTQDRPGGPRRRRYKFYPSIIIQERLKGWQCTTRLTFQDELQDFLGMIGGRDVPLADGWSGVRAIEIATAVYESQATGSPVRLSEV